MNGDVAREEAFAYCLDQLRREDRDRYLTLLFAPRERRPLLAGLYAFNVECARAVNAGGEQPVLGQMRLQWWRDALAKDSEIHSDGSATEAHPIICLLRAETRLLLPTQGLLSARERDLTDSQFETLDDVIAHAAAIGGGLAVIAAETLGADDSKAPRAAGTAFALAGMLRTIPYQVPGRAFQGRLCLSQDILAAHSLRAEDVWSGGHRDAVANCVRQVADAAISQLAELEGIGTTGGAISPLLHGSLARAYLRRLESSGYNPFSPNLGLQPLARPLMLWWRAFLRRP